MRKLILISFIVIFLLTYFVSADSLTFYESFDNVFSIDNNNGTYYDPINFDGGILGNAVMFRGLKIYYPIEDNLNINEGTISFWVKPIGFFPSGNGYLDIGGVGGTSSMGVFRNHASNEVFFELKDDGDVLHQIYKTNAVSIGNWTNIVITYRFNSPSDFMRLYINGLLGNPKTANLDFNPLGSWFMVGGSGPYWHADSFMDELKIYDYVMSSTEIKNDYNDIIGYVPPIVPPAKPESKGPVKINSSGLFVNNKSFFIKGAGYQAIPICKEVSYPFYTKPTIYEQDLDMLRDMNANAIRTWATVNDEDFLDYAYNNGVNPIYVIMSYYIDTRSIDYSDPSTRSNLKQGFKDYVSRYKNHPAVLMWIVGNENNLHYTGDISYWYSLVNELAKVAYEEEGDTYHPVAGVNGGLFNIGNKFVNGDDISLNYTDYWAVNEYPGYTFDTFLGDYSMLTSKPILLSEYGIDSLDNNLGTEYEDVHADWIVSQWKGIVDSDVTLGGTVMAFSDEWWKSGSICNHTKDMCYTTTAHPDSCSNEEWWGITRAKYESNTSERAKKLAYYALKEEFSKVEFSINLSKGWNLVSIPLVLSDPILPAPFQSIEGSYSHGFAYIDGIWYDYYAGDPPGEERIEPGIGFWINMTNDDILEVEGYEVIEPEVELVSGWNLLGYPFMQEMNASEIAYELNATMIYSYNGSWLSYVPNRIFNSLQTLKPGYGYWVKKK